MPTSEQYREVNFTLDNGDTWTKGLRQGAIMLRGEMVGWKVEVIRSQADFYEGQDISLPLDVPIVNTLDPLDRI